jgi:uncharacterized membrane protein YeaQ/YmgE (transglycosylase-associated protein family)
MMIVVAALAGLVVGLLAELVRRRFGTAGAVLTVALGCALAVIVWLPHRETADSGWAVVSFMVVCNLTDLLTRQARPVADQGSS